MKVYVDMLFIINFLMDYFILRVVLMLNNQKFNKWRIVLGATVGGITGTLSFFVESGASVCMLINFLICVVIVLLSFGWTNVKSFYKLMLTYYFTTLFTGGVMIGINFLTQTPIFANSGLAVGVFYANISFLNFFALVATAYLCLFFSKQILALFKSKMQCTYEATFFYDNKKVQLHGFLDTGNTLKDPIHNKNVTIVTMKIAKKLFNKGIYDILQKGNGDTVKCFESLSEVKTGFFLIPVRTLCEKDSFLIGFLGERLEIEKGKGDNLVIETPVFAVAMDKILQTTNYDTIFSQTTI